MRKLCVSYAKVGHSERIADLERLDQESYMHHLQYITTSPESYSSE